MTIIIPLVFQGKSRCFPPTIKSLPVFFQKVFPIYLVNEGVVFLEAMVIPPVLKLPRAAFVLLLCY